MRQEGAKGAGSPTCSSTRRRKPGLEVITIAETHHPREAMVVCNETEPRVIDGIHILPWRDFTQRLWAGEIVA